MDMLFHGPFSLPPIFLNVMFYYGLLTRFIHFIYSIIVYCFSNKFGLLQQSRWFTTNYKKS